MAARSRDVRASVDFAHLRSAANAGMEQKPHVIAAAV
jgi:hypothetical protein